MYLTQMPLDLTKRDTMLALSSPEVIHGAVESSFQTPRERRLWRIDRLNNGKQVLLIVSDEIPNLIHAANQIGYETHDFPWATKDYSQLLSYIRDEDVFQFRLTAFPSHDINMDGDRDHKCRCAHTTVEHQKKWLMDRAERNGFYVDEDDFDVTRNEWYNFVKHKNGDEEHVSFLGATFEGYLKVADAEKFRSALTKGIGHAKCYGMGMLTISCK